MLKYRHGDLFQNLPKRGVIAHVCNDIYVMGSGFVIPLKRRWQIVEEEYKRVAPLLGETQIINVEKNLYVANMVAQHGINGVGGRHRPLRYVYLAKCMLDVARFARDHELEIVAPLFGAGLAGGDWNLVEMFIYEAWEGLDATIYQIPTGAGYVRPVGEFPL